MGNVVDDIRKSEEMQKVKECGAGLKLYGAAEKLAEKIRGEESEYPVNVRRIVKRFGLGICETNLNVDLGFRVEKVNGYLHRKCDGGYVINLHSGDSEYYKRYYMAHVLCRYLLRNADPVKSGVNYADPLFSKDRMDITADIVSAFLLFPPKRVMEYFVEFADVMKKKNEYPIDATGWIHFLAENAQISFYHTLSCYQHLKAYFCYLYDSDPGNELFDAYKDFFGHV